jgi:hypothetical protein
MQPQQRREQVVEALAFEDDVVANEESDPSEGDNGEQLEATTQ